MSLPSLSIRRPVFAWMLTLAIFLFGGISFFKLGISLLPDIDYPYLTVSVDYPGAAPELVESEITDVLEGALSGVSGVRSMNSTSRYGNSRVSLEFDISQNIDFALQEVQSIAQTAFRRLPQGVEAPTIRKTNPEDQPILWVTLSGIVNKRELMEFARNTIRDRFTALEGVSDVQLGGFVDPAIRIWVDPSKLAALELTHEDIVTTLSSEHTELPVGRITTSKEEISLRFEGEAPDLKTLENFSITRRSGQPLHRKIKLKDVARVELGLEDIRRFARTEGKEAVGIGILKQRGSNSVAVADRVVDLVNSLKLPDGYELGINFDTTQPIRKSIHELLFTLGLSVLLTSLVCWLFLGSFVSTFNILIAIPTSLLGTFIAFQGLDYTLNNFTMLALILGVGIIVDDAIMVLENIFRWRAFEPDPSLSARRGAEQVQSAALATSLAVIAIFIPVVYVSGIIGAYLTQFAIALSIAVAFSTFEALTFTPMRLAGHRSSATLKGIPRLFSTWVSRSAEKYARLVERLCQTPLRVYLVLAIVFIASAAVIRWVPKELIPDEDQGMLTATVELPLGTSLSETGRRLVPIEDLIQAQEGVRKVYSVIGGFGSSNVNSARVMISLVDKSDRKLDHLQIQSELREKLKSSKDLRVRISASSRRVIGGGRSGSPIALSLKGSNWEDLVKTSKALEAALTGDSMFKDVKSDFEDGAPEYKVVPKREAALARGVSLGNISETLAFYYQGIKPVKFTEGGRRINTILQVEEPLRPSKPEDFRALYVRNNRGQLISLADLVEVRKGSVPVSISRENRERTIEVSASLVPGVPLDQALTRAEEIFKSVEAPGVRLDDSGSKRDFDTTFRDLTLALALGILVAYMVLASQFNSYLDPLLILLALPFSFGGAFVALKLSGHSLNLYSGIGLLLLMGIVKKNSIMLVEFANQIFEENRIKLMTRKEAMLEACRTRFRPILMTAFTTIAAAAPPAFQWGLDSAATASMSMGIIGGLLLSTALTLLIVPLAYVHLKETGRRPSQ